MRVLRVAVIGAGGFAETCHVPGLQAHPDARVVALCGRRFQHAREMADRLGVSDVHVDYREACSRPDVDAVTLCTPNSEHRAQALLALSLGKHVFCEKPLGITVEEAEEMHEAAEASGRIHLTAFTFRYTHPLQELRRRVRAGDIGRPYHLRMRFDGWGGLRSGATAGWRENLALGGGGVLYDMGSHLFDTAAFLFNSVNGIQGWTLRVPRELPDARTGEPRPVETDDMAAAWFTAGEGVRGEWGMSRVTPPLSDNGFALVTGTEGALYASLGRGQTDALRVSRPGGGWEALPLPEESSSGTAYGLTRMMGAFVNACLRGRPDPEIDATFTDGLAAQRAIHAVETAQPPG